MRTDDERIDDIIKAIEEIESQSHHSEAEFFENRMLQVWMIYHLQIIGEAAGRLSEKAKSQYPEIAWKMIVNFRNIIVHAYFDVDLFEVWDSVTKDIPELKKALSIKNN